MKKKLNKTRKVLKFSRNYPLLSKEEQKSLQSFLIIGVGLGINSVILRDLCRLGIHQFLIADGDKVTLENLNRQDYSILQIGKPKTTAVKENLKKINPAVKIETFNKFVTQKNLSDFFSLVRKFRFSTTIVIDGVDPFKNISISKLLGIETLERSWFYFYPADLGWGSGLVIFTPKDKMKLEEFFGIPPAVGNMINYVKKYAKVPSYVLKLFDIQPYPQPITSVLCASILTLNAILKLVKKDELPHIQMIDPIESYYSRWH